jgi:hypothetical protein
MLKRKGKRLIVKMLVVSMLVGLISPNMGIPMLARAADATTEAFLSKYSIPTDTSGGKQFQTSFSNYITVDGTKLMDGENELKFVSLNYPQATSDNEWEQTNAIKTIKAMGGNVTRTYTIPVYNGNNAATAYVTGVDSQGKLTFNEDALNKLDSLLNICNQYGIRVIIPLVDHWHWVGGMDGYCRLAGIPINTTASLDPNAWQFYTNETAKNYFKQMISHLMERTNTVSGIKYKDDPAVICWETGNEIAAYDDTSNPKFPQQWTTDIAAHLKSTGIHQLVLDGKMDATAEALKDPNVDILGSHYYTGYYPDKLRKDTTLAFNNGSNPVLDTDGNMLAGKPFILGEFGGYTKASDVEKVLNAGLEVGSNGMMMWSLRAHKDGYGYYFHPEDPGNWAAYHWPGFPSGEYYDETNIVRTLYAYANIVNGNAADIAAARLIPIPAPETEEAPLLYPVTTVGDIQWRGVVGGAWYEIQRAEGTNPSEGDWVTIADQSDYVYDSGRNWENKNIPCIAGYHDETAITGHTYSYRLRACNESGTGLWSNVETTEAAEHVITDNLDMISVSSSDQNSTEIRNTYSYDHSANVTLSGGVLQNTSSTEGYITYSAKIPMSSLEITTKNTPEVVPKVYISADDIVYQEVTVTGSGSSYLVDSLPTGTYFARVYVAPNNGCMLDLVKTVYTYSGDPGELYEHQDMGKDVLIQDESFNPADPMYAYKSGNLAFITDQEVHGLATTDGQTAVLIYKTASDMTSFRVTAYGKNGAAPVVEASMDGVSYQQVAALPETAAVGNYTKYIYANVDVSVPTRFVRVTYPASQGDVVIGSVEVASGSKRLPMQDKAPMNVLEDGEYYFGSDTKLQSAYSIASASVTKSLTNADFSSYDVLYAWIKGDNSGNKLILSLTDHTDVTWKAEQVLTGTTGSMVKFEFKDFTTDIPDAILDFTEVKSFTMGIEGATAVTISLDPTNFYTGNYGVKLDYTKDAISSGISIDNIYVGSLTKVDDYEGYNGANSLLQSAYSRNTNGGSLNLSLDPSIKSEGAYALRLDYNYEGKGYAGATKYMDYLNLKDYDGFKIWYIGDGSGNSLTFQIKTSDGLSWEAIGYMNGTGATELYMPFDSFVAPSWDPREGSLNKNLNITDFSIYTNKVGSGSETGTIYFDDIKGANFIEDLKTAAVDITTETNQVITQFPYTIEGTANYVKYITLKMGTKTINVPVNGDGTWSYTLQKEDNIYNTESLDVSASILYHNYNRDPIAADSINLGVQVADNDEPVDVVYENYAKNGDFSGGFTDWTVDGFAVSDGVADKLENGAFVCWSNEAYQGTLSQTLTVPNGVYTLKAKMKVKSGFNDARMGLSSGASAVQSVFLDTQDTEKTVSLDKTIEVRNGQITITFTADAPAGGLVFMVDDVELNKVGEINLITNGDFELVGAEWPNLPTGWQTAYTGGDGWSPIKGDQGEFVGYADNAYTFTLSQNVSDIAPGIYALTANVVLNNGEINSLTFAVNGNGVNAASDVLSSVQSGNGARLDNITIGEGAGTVAVSILGDIVSKGLSIDNVTLIKTGELPPRNYITNGDFTLVGSQWPNIPVDWVASYEGGDGWSPVKGENGALVGYADNAYTFTLSQAVSGIEDGLYKLSANIKLNDGIVNDVVMTVKAGETVLAQQSVFSHLAANTSVPVSIENIPIGTDTVTVTISGDIGSKGLTIDDVALIRTGNLPAVNYIENPSFEANAGAVTGGSIIGWISSDSWGTGELSKTEAGGYDGDYALSRWWSEPYTATNTQTLSSLPSGIYVLKAWAMSKAAEPEKPYEITTIGIKVGDLPIRTVQVEADQSWKQYVIGNIEIKNGDIVSVVIDTNDTVGNGWTKIDMVELNKVADINVTPTPDPVTPTPDPVTPTPDPVTPTPDPVTPTPDPVTPVPGPVIPAPERNDVPQINGSGSKGWDTIASELKEASGDKVTIVMNGNTVIPKEILESIKDIDVEVSFDLGGGITWIINGKDLGKTDSFDDMNLKVTLNSGDVPSDLKDNFPDKNTTELSIAYEGSFGFPATLKIDMNQENKGKIANLYYYNPSTKKLELQVASKVQEDGTVELPFTHASDYVLVLDNKVLLDVKGLNITVAPSSKTLYVGGNKDGNVSLKVTLPDVVTESVQNGLLQASVKYQTSDKTVATVSSDGVITAKKPGKAVIKTTVTIEGITRVFTTKITVKKAYIKVVKSTVKMKKGDSFTFTATGYGVDTESITWLTSKKSIIVIGKTSGKATAASAGTDYVIAKVGKVTVKMKVEVTAAEKK